MAQAQNLGTGGSVLNAQYGSAPTTNANAPLLLQHSGTNYLYLPGVTNANYAFTLDPPAAQITGNLELVSRIKLTNYSTAAVQSLSNKDAWNWFVYGGIMYLSIRTSAGYSFNTATSSSPPFVAGTTYWLRMRRVSATGAVTFSYAPDQPSEPTSWTNLVTAGPQVAGALTYFPGENLLLGLTDFLGNYYRHIIRNGIGGTIAYDADFTTGITSGAQLTFTESSVNATTVYIGRATSGRKAVAVVRDVWLLGLDDWFEVTDNALLDFTVSESFTVMAVVRQWATPLLSGRYVSKGGGGGANTWVLISSGITQAAEFRADGTTGAVSALSPASTSGTLRSFSAVHNGSTAVVTAYLNGTAGTPAPNFSTGNYANTSPLIVGATPGGLLPQEFECLGVAIWRRALTQAEIAAIAAYYGT